MKSRIRKLEERVAIREAEKIDWIWTVYVKDEAEAEKYIEEHSGENILLELPDGTLIDSTRRLTKQDLRAQGVIFLEWRQ
jgi:hypothetical protein